MSLMLLFFIIGCISVVVIAEKQHTEQDFQEIRQSILRAVTNGIHSDNLDSIHLKSKTTTASYQDGDPYKTTGSVAIGYFSDSRCTDMISSYGLFVNNCYIGDGYSYRVRLYEDGCNHGTIDYYAGKSCTQYYTRTELGDSRFTQCAQLYPGVFAKTLCTASSQPRVFDNSAVQIYYSGICSTPEMYSAWPSNTCYSTSDSTTDLKYDCSTGQLRLVYYSGASGCTGPFSSYQFDSRMCYSASSPYTSTYTSTASNTAPTDATTITTSAVTAERGEGNVIDRSSSTIASGWDLGNALRDGVQVPLKVVKLLRTIATHNAKQRLVGATFTSSGSAASTTTATTATTTDHSHTTHTLATTPTAAPTLPASDDDVNYYDDDTNNRHYSYEYYTPGDDDANIYAHDDAAYYSYDVLPAPPSIVSTAFPTTVREGNKQYTARLMCTQPPTAQLRTLTVKQGLSLSSVSAYTANKAMCDKSISQAVAAVVEDATETSVSGVNYALIDTDTSAAGVNHTHIDTDTSVAGVNYPLIGTDTYVTYTLTVRSSRSADDISGQLRWGVKSNNFAYALRAYGRDNGISNITAAAYSAYIESKVVESDSTSTQLSTGAIIGIAIGAAAFLVICIAGVYYYCSKRQSTEYEAPQLHDVDVAVVEEGQQQEDGVELQGSTDDVLVVGVELTHFSSSITPTTTTTAAVVDVCVKLDDSVPVNEEEQV